MTQTFKFIVEHPGEPGAGILPFTEEVEIGLRTGFEETGERELFESVVAEFLVGWYDGASVLTEAQADEREKQAESGTLPPDDWDVYNRRPL